METPQHPGTAEHPAGRPVDPEPPTGVARMRVVGGDPALDFVNTRSGPPAGPPDDDVLGSYDDLVAWARHVGLLTAAVAAELERNARRDPDAAAAAFQQALRVRDCLDDVFRALASGERPPAGALHVLGDAEVEALAHAELAPGDGDAGFQWSWDNDRSAARLLRPVVHSATRLLTSGPLDRIKACAGCRFLFLDESRNRSRRWCSMEDCGTTEKIRRYVARRAARR